MSTQPAAEASPEWKHWQNSGLDARQTANEMGQPIRDAVLELAAA